MIRDAFVKRAKAGEPDFHQLEPSHDSPAPDPSAATSRVDRAEAT